MKQPDDRPSRIVSLESRRRQKQAEERARAKAQKARPTHERAINWGRIPLFVAVVVAFMVASWLFHFVGAFLNPFR